MSDRYEDWRDRLASAIDRRFYTIEWLDGLLRDQAALFLATSTAAIIIEFKPFPSGLWAVHGLVAAGDMDEIINDMIPRAEAIGIENGCAIGLIESRPGWAKAMKSSGYEPFQLSIAKEL